MQEILEMITNYGIGIVCVVYMIFFQNTTMKEMTTTMQKMTTTLEGVNIRLSFIEDQLKETNGKSNTDNK